METIAFLDPVRSVPAASWDARRLGTPVSRDAAQADSDCSTTLLAMAGHDLRRLLPVITSAHDVLARSLASEEHREELPRGRGTSLAIGSHRNDHLNCPGSRDVNSLRKGTLACVCW